MNKQIIITAEFAVEVEQTPRGAFATVKDAHSPFNGVFFFGSTPDVALDCLVMKVEQMKQALLQGR